MAFNTHAQSALFKPTSLDDAIDLIANIRSSATAAQESLAKATALAGRDVSEEVYSLVQVRKAIKDGRLDDAIYDLDRVLSILDSGYLCRS